MSRFSTVLFDLDGTLLDHFAAIHRSYAHTLPYFGLPPPTAAETRAAIGGGLRNALGKFFPSEKIDEAERVYRDFWHRTMLEGAELMPGARALLERLAAGNVTLAVLTNKLGSSSRLLCDHLGISPLFIRVYGAEDTPWLKPDPALTEFVLEDLKAERAATLLVGDSPYDIDAAHAGKFPCWVVTTGTHSAAELRAANADAIYPSLGELDAALRAWR